MTECKPSDYKGQNEQTRDIAPEAVNREQVDADAQAQTVAEDAEEAVERSTSVLGEKADADETSIFNENDAEDVVDEMQEMRQTGKIDNSAYAGEPNHDDNTSKYAGKDEPKAP